MSSKVIEKCFGCGSELLEQTEITFDEDTITVWYLCSECHTQWTDTYELISHWYSNGSESYEIDEEGNRIGESDEK